MWFSKVWFRIDVMRFIEPFFRNHPAKNLTRMEEKRYIRRLAWTAIFIPALTMGAPQCPLSAQMQTAVTNPQQTGWLVRARQMFAMGNYRGCADQLRAAPVLTPAEQVLLSRALLMTDDSECLQIARNVRLAEGASPIGVQALMTEGDWHFFHGEYGPASLCYEQLPDASSNPTYAYRLGISELRRGAFARGCSLLRPLAVGNGEYRIPAQFYLAWADYAQHRTQQALKAFEAIESRLPAVNAQSPGADALFLPSALDAGYYIAQIDFEQGRYSEASTRARRLLRGNTEGLYGRELNRVAGESLFKLGKLKDAEPYLQAYLDDCLQDEILPTAAYAMGAIAYNDGRTDSARELLEPIASRRDITGQGASLLLGQIAADRGDYNAAALYFDKAWRYGQDRDVAERGMYNHIAVMARGADIPFASAQELPEQFLNTFPGSQYEGQVREILSQTYYRDKDYTRALENLDRIANPTAQQRAIRQLALYELGISELSNGNAANAETHLLEATKGSDAKVAAQAQLWLGQALYSQGKFAAADRAYRAYLKQNPSGANAAQARYDAAYALYMQDKFREAAEEFTRAIADSNLPERLRTDATVRLADCRYYLRDYTAASQLYAQAAKAGTGDEAYAAMRAAMMQGLRGDLAAEINGLQEMIARHQSSRWTPSAMIELAQTQARNGDIAAAESTYSETVKKYPQLEEGRRAQLQLATLYMKQNSDEQAIAAYQDVIRRWPTGEEAKAANVELRRLMAARGQVAEYAAFMNSVPGAPKIDNAELERLDYENADTRLIANAADQEAMKEYLSRYPDGLYLAPALWRLAQAQNETGQTEQALATIGELETRRPDAGQLPDALMLKGQLLEDAGRTTEALKAYQRAESIFGADMPADVYAGIMRLSTDASVRLEYARTIKSMPSLDSEQVQEADFFEGVALEALGQNDAAATLFKNLATQPSSLYGARGAVAYGQLLIKEKKYKEAQRALEAFTNAGSPHAYWLAHGYIALADAVGMQGNKTLAKEYLEALRSNYPGNEADIHKLIDAGLKKYK